MIVTITINSCSGVGSGDYKISANNGLNISLPYSGGSNLSYNISGATSVSLYIEGTPEGYQYQKGFYGVSFS